MKTSLLNFKLTGHRMHFPESDKGEVNPHTSGTEKDNPYMKKETIFIEREDVPDILNLLRDKGYDISKLA